MRKRWAIGVSLGACLQEPVPNRQQLLGLRVPVVNVCGKGPARRGQVWYQETNESEPFDEMSKVSLTRSEAVIAVAL